MVDPNAYTVFTRKKVDISTRNKNLSVREFFTPAEDEVPQILEQQRLSEEQTPSRNSMSGGNQTPDKFILIKKCTVRKLRGQEDKPLGFEMTKRGNIPHYVSRIEANSAADLAHLAVDDYLIELNDKNIEKDENPILKEKILKLLDPKSNSEFCLTTINKDGFDYCTEKSIAPSAFIQINKNTIQYFETPLELSSMPGNANGLI